MIHFQPASEPALTPFQRLRESVGRRTLAFALVLGIEALLLLMLLTLGWEKRTGEPQESLTVVDVSAAVPQAATPDEPRTKAAEPSETRPVPEQPPVEPAEQAAETPVELPSPPTEVPIVNAAPPVLPTPNPIPSFELPRSSPRPAPSNRPVYGPPDVGGSPALRDSEVVGTAPNGEPLYAASWYREPRPDQLRDYLSTARGPGWGLIACRTAPDYRVEDCVGIDEYPHGSQITRAVLAAAWEFKVRPPRKGGQSLVGSWVRIRIDYGIDRR